ncbi:DUF1254 domain-containing protein [Achromobacter sp. Marseille-Q4962]|uniref:DUF1254 domain-containing protein n=1 Tax=Achromobacter sp. Marseille-Q4962 TaxID=2942202 RepID=UPI002074A977|nr:DUF1254 domain-containing protein [Achromobacter sp. Marseille-Q4962]
MHVHRRCGQPPRAGRLLAASVFFCLGLSACSFTSPDAASGSQFAGIIGVTAQEARSIAREAYLYGTPLIASYRVMYERAIDRAGPAYLGPFNTLHGLDGTKTRGDVAAYAALDLRAEPVVVAVPAPAGAAPAVHVDDLYTFRLATLGRTGGRYLVAGPGWSGHAPAGIAAVIRSETQLASLGVQRAPGAAGAAPAGLSVQPLSAYLGRPAPAPASDVSWPRPLDETEARTSLRFYDQLAFLLQFAPEIHTEAWARERFASIGIRPGEPIDPQRLHPGLRRAMTQGMQQGQAAIDARRQALAGDARPLRGNRATLGNDYLSRAVGAQSDAALRL